MFLSRFFRVFKAVSLDAGRDIPAETPYRDMVEVDRLRSTIEALEKENFQLRWNLIQMGTYCRMLGGNSKYAYKKSWF